MTLTNLTTPAEPLSASDAALRGLLRLEDAETGQDALIDTLCAAARAAVEGYTRQRLITQTVRLRLDRFGPGAIRLPVWPVASIAAVVYDAADGTAPTVDAADYRLVASDKPNWLIPATGKVWPVPRAEPDSVRLDIVAGYGTASAVPPVLMVAIRLLVVHLFEDREMLTAVLSGDMPRGLRDLLDPERFWP